MEKPELGEPGVCPNCGSEDVEYHPVGPIDTDTGVAYRGKCNDCGAKFLEHYELTWVGNQLLSVPKRRKKHGNEISPNSSASS